MRRPITRSGCGAILAAAIWHGGSSVGTAQTASMLGPFDDSAPLTLSEYSWYFMAQEPPKEIRLHDLVTVVVNQSSQMISEGDVQRMQRGRYDAVLSDWVRLSGLALKKAPQLDGDPAIKASLNSQLQTNMDLITRSSLRFRITAEVVDIRPNGNLVVEAHQTVRDNNEWWEASLSGICRREDILPDNTVLSENVAELRIDKREAGPVRDAYKRGWLLRWIDYVRPF
jgi:flagellar L-ring protein precursor FlgH